MKTRPFFLGVSFVFFGSYFSPGLCQEIPELKVQRLLSQIYSLPNIPKLSPVKIVLDKNQNKKYGPAYYLREPRKLGGLKRAKVPEIHLSIAYVQYNSDNAIIVTLAHELGHHFDHLRLYFEPHKPIDKVIKHYDRTEKEQYFAEAFALYILGENLYKRGRLEEYSAYLKDKGVYWLYIETNPILQKYYIDQGELWINYWLNGARSRLDYVIRLVKEQ